ncbi:MAG: hypothetical protein IKJ01_03195 [Lachnospiraceae bacterium]|nr:hypothetical protein [Lachnospiraceae bacterium]
MKFEELMDTHYLFLLEKIQEQSQHKKPFILAIDGMCGSGKTTLATYLSKKLNASVIHMDDFFLPPILKTPTRLSEIGGNIHYERFQQEVLVYINNDTDFSYKAYDCHTLTYLKEVFIKKTPILIIEGSYSLHPIFKTYYDMSIYMCVSAEEQLQRIFARCAKPELQKRFQEEWIPMENAYCNAYKLKETCAFCLDTTNLILRP